jgi:hypothetical protein
VTRVAPTDPPDPQSGDQYRETDETGADDGLTDVVAASSNLREGTAAKPPRPRRIHPLVIEHGRNTRTCHSFGALRSNRVEECAQATVGSLSPR